MDNFKEVSEVIRRASLASVTKAEKYVDKMEKEKPPKDAFYMVYILFLLLGMLNVLPMTFFITANDYWMYKFRDTAKDVVDLNNKTTLQKYFVSGGMVVQTIPSAVTMLLSTSLGHKIKVNTRIIGTLSLISCVFLLFTIFIEVNTDTWQVGFFVLTLSVLALITGVLNLFQVSSMAIVPKFPPVYMKTFLFGQGLAPMFSATLQIASLAFGTSTISSALAYFISGTCLILLSLILYLSIKRTAFYNYYIRTDLEDTKKKHSREEIKAVFFQIWPCLAMLLLIFLTMSFTHPSITTLVVSEYYNKGSKWNDVFFVPTITFLFTEGCSQIGKLLSRPLVTKTNGFWLVSLVILRMVVLVPLVLFCNAQPRNHLPVYLTHDWQYILVCAVYFFSSGFLLNGAFLSIQRLTEKEDVAFLIMLSCLGVSGAVLSPLSLVVVRIL